MRSASALVRMALLNLLFLYLFSPCIHRMCLFTSSDIVRMNTRTLEHALSVFIPSVSRRTGWGLPEKWSYISVDLRECPVSDRSTGSHMVPSLRL